MKVIVKAKVGEEFRELVVAPFGRGFAKLTLGDLSFTCRIADLRSALDSIEGYVKANAKNSSDHAYKVGDVVDLYPVKGSDGRVIARAPDGRVVLFAKDSQPDEGKQVRAIIVVSKPTYYIAKPVAEAGEK